MVRESDSDWEISSSNSDWDLKLVGGIKPVNPPPQPQHKLPLRLVVQMQIGRRTTYVALGFFVRIPAQLINNKIKIPVAQPRSVIFPDWNLVGLSI